MSAPIRFLFRGQPVAVPADTPTRTVLQWLREDRQACGTKEGCAEGDCGACTVLVAELPETLPEGTQAVLSAGLALRPVNACIRFLPTLHGKALFAVEDVAAADGTLHPVQQAWLELDVAQCGYCQPGQIMAAVALLNRTKTPTDADIDAIDNVCRCGTYGRIRAAIKLAASRMP